MLDGADITCQSCGVLNGLGARFCNGCGHRIDGVCPSCGHQNNPSARFCNSCGQSLSEEARQAAPGPPAPSASACPRCLRKNEPGSQFCYHCGLPLEGEAARAAPPAIGAFEQGEPGGFWLRVVAFIIDSVVSSVLGLAINLLFGGDIDNYWNPNTPFMFADFAEILFALLYAPVLIGLWSTTVGKRAMNLYVVRSDGGRCGFWRALGRTFAMFLSAILLGIGFLMIAFREDKRGLHDLIAGTAVIRRYG